MFHSTGGGEETEEGRRREYETYWLTSPPSVIEFLSPSKAEAGIKHWVIHRIANDSMWFRIESLCAEVN